MKRRLLLSILLTISMSAVACGDDDPGTGNNGDNNGTADAGDTGDAGGDATDPGDAGDTDEGDGGDADDDGGDAEDDGGDADDDTGDTSDEGASLTADDQFLAASSSDTVTVAQAVSEGVGWVVIYADDGGAPGEILGQAGVSDGENSDVIVALDRDVTEGETLYAMLHTESEPDADPIEFDATTDVPQTDDNDDPITDSFVVTLPQVDASDITLNDLSTVVTIDSVRSKGDGWIVIYENDCATGGAVIGSAALTDGDNSDIEVVLSRPAEDDENLCATLHLEDPADGDFTFDATDNATEDVPASLAQSAEAIQDSFNVQLQGDVVAVRITIGAAGSQSYSFNNVEPLAFADDLGLAGIDTQDFEDPTIELNQGWRYEIINNATSSEPLELIEEGAGISGDEVLFSQTADGAAEGDTEANWVEDGDAVRFTVAGDGFVGNGGLFAGTVDTYRSQAHPDDMRGTITINTP